MASKYGDWTRGEEEALLNILGAAGGGDGAVVARRILRDEVEVKLISKIRIKTFKVRFNYDQPIEQKTVSGFTFVDRNITSQNFPVNQSGEAELEAVAVNFGRVITSLDEVRRSFEGMGLSTGIPTGLADVSNQHQTKELDECLPLVAPDPVWRVPYGYERVVYLSGEVGRRGLDLYCAAGEWDERCWFLGFRKCQ